MSGSPWAVLGIAWTSDDGSIRRAYADRLRQIDPDTNPAAFTALRAALKAAREQAARAIQVASPTYRDRPPPPPLPLPGAVAVPPDQEQRSADQRPIAAAVIAAAGWREVSELEREVFAGLDEGEPDQALVERSWRVVRSIELLTVDQARTAEERLLQIALTRPPRSDAVLIVACEHFGWPERAAGWNCPPSIRAAAKRYWDVGYAQSLERSSDPADGDALAFRILRTPGAAPRERHADIVASFLAGMRLHHPTLIADLPAGAVECWQDYLAKRDARWTRRSRAWLAHRTPAAYLRRNPEAKLVLRWIFIILISLVLLAAGPFAWWGLFRIWRPIIKRWSA